MAAADGIDEGLLDVVGILVPCLDQVVVVVASVHLEGHIHGDALRSHQRERLHLEVSGGGPYDVHAIDLDGQSVGAGPHDCERASHGSVVVVS